MNELIARYAPLLLQGLEETLYMTVFSTVLAYVFGLPLGVLVYVTKDGGIHPNRPLNRVLSWFINLIRSVPFLILIVALNPISKLIAGTSIGPKSSIFALVVAAAPFVARMVESSLEELDTGVIEAAKTMGASDLQIITKVLLPESVPSLVRGPFHLRHHSDWLFGYGRCCRRRRPWRYSNSLRCTPLRRLRDVYYGDSDCRCGSGDSVHLQPHCHSDRQTKPVGTSGSSPQHGNPVLLPRTAKL